MAEENIVSQDGRFRLVSLTPDVCLTPTKNGEPVPYPITHTMDQSQRCSPNVFLQDEAVYLHNESFVDNIKGDEPGAGKGVISGTHVNISHNIDKSKNVFVNGKQIVRTGDAVWMNWEKPGTPSPKPSAASGLGESVDELVNKSPTLQKDLHELAEDGWDIKYGASGGGSYADRANKVIVLDSDLQGDAATTTQVLAHEVGHANYDYKPDFSSRSAFVNGTLADEGAATLKNIQVQREIIGNGGPDISVAGNPHNHVEYNTIYNQYLKDGNATAAEHAIGKIFGQGEITSTTHEPYADYYGGWYDDNFTRAK